MDRWGLIETAFHGASGVPSDQRDAWLRDHLRETPDLIPEVERLLAASQAGPKFLEPVDSKAVTAGAVGTAAPVSPSPVDGPMRSSELLRAQWVGSRIGGVYTITDLLGEGGFGIVFRGERTEPALQQAAIKILRPGAVSETTVARFEMESRALASLDHPNIARLYDVGITDADAPHPGIPYFVMELVEGESLVSFADRRRASVDERLALFLEVCDAVSHAHARAVIHRDLKPSNILVGESSHGRPGVKVIDFGIAKIASGTRPQVAVTESGQLVGTPRYMSPEHLAGGAVDTRSDVYSLGALLYELLVGVTPVDVGPSESPLAFQTRIERGEIDRPSVRLRRHADRERAAVSRATDASSLVSQLSGDLDWIAMRCLESDPDRRYGSSIELATDIRDHMSDRPIRARPPTLRYLASKTIRRHRTGFAFAAVALVGVVATIVGLAAGLIRARVAERHERDAREQADAALASEQKQLYVATIGVARAAIASRDITSAQAFLAQSPEEHRDWEWWHLRDRADQSIATLIREEGVATRPYGLQLAGGRLFLSRLTEDERYRYDWWDRETLEPLGTCAFRASGRPEFAVSPDGTRLVTLGREVTVWDTTTSESIASLSVIGRWAGFSRDGASLFVIPPTGGLVLFETETWTPTNVPMDVDLSIHTAMCTETGEVFSREARTHDVIVIDSRELRVTERLGVLGGGAGPIAVSPDGDRVATVVDGVLSMLHRGSAEPAWRSRVGRAGAVAFSPDGTSVWCGSSDGSLRVVDAATGLPRYELVGHEDGVQAIVFESDREAVLSASRDGTVRQWSREEQKSPLFLPIGVGIPSAFDVSADGRFVMYSTFGGHAAVYARQDLVHAADAGELVQPIFRESGEGSCVCAFVDDGMLVARMGAPLRLVDPASGRIVRRHATPTNLATHILDGRWWLASDHDAGVVRIASCASPEESVVLEGAPVFATDRSTLFAIARDSDLVVMRVVGSDEAAVAVWDARTGASLGRRVIETSVIMPVLFAAEEPGCLWGAFFDGTLVRWHVERDEILERIETGRRPGIVCMDTMDRRIVASDRENFLVLDRVDGRVLLQEPLDHPLVYDFRYLEEEHLVIAVRGSLRLDAGLLIWRGDR